MNISAINSISNQSFGTKSAEKRIKSDGQSIESNESSKKSHKGLKTVLTLAGIAAAAVAVTKNWSKITGLFKPKNNFGTVFDYVPGYSKETRNIIHSELAEQAKNMTLSPSGNTTAQWAEELKEAFKPDVVKSAGKQKMHYFG